ncbi:MAG TPA: amylo-alpha-1,6-glucosidase [Polyangiaceae bacterium]|nr:amylo-alpha-1,6-glucosidase [Polyangiaceae bacterium]
MPAETSVVPIDTHSEWLEADGLGGFASGTTAGIATRRYHALLLAANNPPSSRFVLVNGFRAWLETPAGTLQLTRHHFAPDVLTSADARIEAFSSEPWPKLSYVTSEGLVVSQEIFVLHGSATVLVSFRLESKQSGVKLCVRPFLSGRDFHALHRENADFGFEPEQRGGRLRFSPYPGVPSIDMLSNGAYQQKPEWYRNFRYTEEAERGLDCDEDLAAPGILSFDLSNGPAIWISSASTPGEPLPEGLSAERFFDDARRRELARRGAFASPLERAADSYLVARGQGRTIIAGYPWFCDWGRDTFIALRGLCFATGRLREACDILVEWSHVVSDGMLPNLFPDNSGRPEYNSVDASLWYVLAASELLQDAQGASLLSPGDRAALKDAILAIVSGYARGTRFGIRRDTDGLLACGEPGTQLTWMDAKVAGHVVTPRCGKPVEIQALWLNALSAAAHLSPEFSAWVTTARASFELRFWNAAGGFLYDVVDVDHQPGKVDASLRPNQIFAAGGLPVSLLSPERSRRVLDVVEQRLLTPLGLRSLAAGDPAYVGHYQGNVWHRDTAYHQGTVWPWLMGPFVEAWLKNRGLTDAAKRDAERRFVTPLRAHLCRAGIGHVSEIADAEPPYTPRGCPFQAWSVSELLRLSLLTRID